MAKITRANQKIFASSPGANQIATYGSLKAGAPAFTTDPETIQSLTNYLTGWFGAVIGDNSPAIEDMNALCYLFAYQLAYLFQAGIPEWNSETSYYIGSLVQSSNGRIYRSLADDNLNNDPTTNPSYLYWGAPILPGALTQNDMVGDVTVQDDTAMTWANAIVPSGKQLTIDADGNFVGINELTVNGTTVVNGTLRII